MLKYFAYPYMDTMDSISSLPLPRTHLHCLNDTSTLVSYYHWHRQLEEGTWSVVDTAMADRRGSSPCRHSNQRPRSPQIHRHQPPQCSIEKNFTLCSMVLDFSSFKWHKNSILAANQTSSSFNLMITYSQFYQRSVAISRSGTYLLSLFIDRFFLPLIFFFHVFVMPGKDGGKFCPLFYEFIICSNTYHSTLNKIVIWIYKSIFSSAIPNQRKIRLKLINTKQYYKVTKN